MREVILPDAFQVLSEVLHWLLVPLHLQLAGFALLAGAAVIIWDDFFATTKGSVPWLRRTRRITTVYLFQSVDRPNLVKVGFTARRDQARQSELQRILGGAPPGAKAWEQNGICCPPASAPLILLPCSQNGPSRLRHKPNSVERGWAARQFASISPSTTTRHRDQLSNEECLPIPTTRSKTPRYNPDPRRSFCATLASLGSKRRSARPTLYMQSNRQGPLSSRVL